MSDEELEGKARLRAGTGKQLPPATYTSKDFQLDVLGKLAETQEAVEAWSEELESLRDQRRLLRFDPRTLVAIGAIALSLTGYILQDARNSSRRDAEIETIKWRVAQLERAEAANTEGRIRAEVELGGVQAGRAEIKGMVEGRTNAKGKTRENPHGKSASGESEERESH